MTVSLVNKPLLFTRIDKRITDSYRNGHYHMRVPNDRFSNPSESSV